MPFNISATLEYAVARRSTVLLNLHAMTTSGQQLRNESFTVTEGASCDFFCVGDAENRYVRLDTGALTSLKVTYDVEAETSPEPRHIRGIDTVPVTGLQAHAIPYLFPSRYCQSDRFGLLAAKAFGHIPHPLAQANAISDWVFENLDYAPGSTDASTSAVDSMAERRGVCRDFAHLGVSLCRALSIPARYVTAYACDMTPPDFHACFEACVGNEWFVFDPTRLSSPNGLIRIAVGRDAADTAFATIFGQMQLQSMEVSCTAPDFTPLDSDQLRGKAVLLEPQA